MDSCYGFGYVLGSLIGLTTAFAAIALIEAAFLWLGGRILRIAGAGWRWTLVAGLVCSLLCWLPLLIAAVFLRPKLAADSELGIWLAGSALSVAVFHHLFATSWPRSLVLAGGFHLSAAVTVVGLSVVLARTAAG